RSGHGLLWLARGLEVAPDGAAELNQSLRTLLSGWGRQLHPLRAVFQHPRRADYVAFSPDGQTIVTATFGSDGTARLWERATGKLIGEPLRHDDGVFAVAFSPDRKTLVTGGMVNNGIGEARRWDVATGKPIGQP